MQVYGLGASRPRGSLGFRAGPVVRWTRHARSSAGRAGAIVVIGFLSGLVGVAVQRGNALHGILPGRVRAGSEVPGARCTTNGAASCSERHRSVDVYLPPPRHPPVSQLRRHHHRLPGRSVTPGGPSPLTGRHPAQTSRGVCGPDLRAERGVRRGVRHARGAAGRRGKVALFIVHIQLGVPAYHAIETPNGYSACLA